METTTWLLLFQPPLPVGFMERNLLGMLKGLLHECLHGKPWMLLIPLPLLVPKPDCHAMDFPLIHHSLNPSTFSIAGPDCLWTSPPVALQYRPSRTSSMPMYVDGLNLPMGRIP